MELSDHIISNEKESFDWNLAHQLCKIICWEALFDEGIDAASLNQTT